MFDTEGFECPDCGEYAFDVSVTQDKPSEFHVGVAPGGNTIREGRATYITISGNCGSCGLYETEEMTQEHYLKLVGKLFFGFYNE